MFEAHYNTPWTGTFHKYIYVHTHRYIHTTVLWPFFWDYPGEPVPEENLLLDFMVQGKINRGRHIDHPAGRSSILHLD